ncbi:MAG TPA: hypothetical protein PK121_02505, partial [Candidatus Pacearchaeota archaeon]|nr:hypothetical protein [Candidatus Pacearchaeota archaeon]
GNHSFSIFLPADSGYYNLIEKTGSVKVEGLDASGNVVTSSTLKNITIKGAGEKLLPAFSPDIKDQLAAISEALFSLSQKIAEVFER